MNKNAIQKMMIAAIACMALCGTTLAAPAHKPAQGRAPAPQVAHHHAPVHHAAPRTTLAAADAAGYAQSLCPATPCHRHHRHECHDCHYDDNGWVELGAGIIGGIIGALIAG